MRATSRSIAVYITAVAVILGSLGPASAAGIEEADLRALFDKFGTDPDHTTGFGSLPAWAATEPGSREDLIRQLKEQTSVPAPGGDGPAEPLLTPVPVPSRYPADGPACTGDFDRESLKARYSAQKAAIMQSLGTKPGDQPGAPGTGNGREVVQANNRFALDFYARLAGEEDGNIFFSPFSISNALAITCEGARGTTADEIRSVFHFPEDAPVMRDGFAGTIAGINRGSSAYTLRTANALWAEQTYPFLPEYTSTAERYYSATATNLDFINEPEVSRTTINRWVEDQTEDRIRDLLPAGSIDSLTRLVITNAVYFKGTWVKQFDGQKTTEEEFRSGNGMTVRVPMMQRTDKDAVFGYAETRTFQALSMPYESDGGKGLSMLVILPKGDDMRAVEASLDAAALDDLQQSIVSRQVMVYFPKFTVNTKYSLPRTLAEMGMPTAFSGSADFSGMDGTRNLAISDVIHQAFVEVTEEGTEAAAATGVVMRLTSAGEPVPVFRADHPFIFIIRDDETGTILFMGRVTSPAAS